MKKPSLHKNQIFDREHFKSFFAEKIPARVHMTIILITTMASGVVVSKVLLFSQMQSMALRYSLAVLFSYCVFFLLLRLWIQFHFEDETDPQNSQHFDSDFPGTGLDTLIDSVNFPSATSGSKPWTGDGGQFSGGGASGSWSDRALKAKESVSAETNAESSSSVSLGDADELGAILLFIALIGAICFSSAYIIYYAPEIMLEAAFEVVLASMITRKIKTADSNDWMKSLFKKTWIPFAIILVIAGLFGTYLKTNCPEAISYRQYLNQCSHSEVQ